MDGGPRLSGVGGDVVESEEGFDGVNKVFHAQGLVCGDKLSVGIAITDGGAAEFGKRIGGVKIQGPVLQSLLRRRAFSRVS